MFGIVIVDFTPEMLLILEMRLSLEKPIVGFVLLTELFLLFLGMKVILKFESPIELWVVAKPKRLECCELKPNQPILVVVLAKTGSKDVWVVLELPFPDGVRMVLKLPFPN